MADVVDKKSGALIILDGKPLSLSPTHIKFD